MTPIGGATPQGGNFATPMGGAGMETPLPSQLSQMTPEQINEFRCVYTYRMRPVQTLGLARTD